MRCKSSVSRLPWRWEREKPLNKAFVVHIIKESYVRGPVNQRKNHDITKQITRVLRIFSGKNTKHLPTIPFWPLYNYFCPTHNVHLLPTIVFSGLRSSMGLGLSFLQIVFTVQVYHILFPSTVRDRIIWIVPSWSQNILISKSSSILTLRYLNGELTQAQALDSLFRHFWSS